MQATGGIQSRDDGLHKIPVQMLEHECGPIPGLDSIFSKIKKVQTEELMNAVHIQENETPHESDDQKTTISERLLTSFKSPVHAFRPLKTNVTISNGRVHLQPSNSNILHPNGLQEKMKDCNDTPIAASVTPNHPSGLPKRKSPVSTLAPTRLVPKVVMSTVPKRVPLVSTVGNFSKAPAFAASVLSSTAANQSSPCVPVTSISSHSEVKPTMSILEARLTGCDVGGSYSQNEQRKLPSLSPASTSGGNNVKVSSSGAENQAAKVSSNMGGISCKEPKLHSSGKLQTSTKPHPQPLAVLNYEKGLTRLLPVKARSVVQVDVGVQVVLPNPETGKEVTDKSHDSGASTPAVTTGTPSIDQGTSMPSVSSSSPLKPGQFVTVNPKTGKMMIAIPKHMIKSSSGPKTLVINGKPVKVQVKKAFSCNGSLPEISPKVEISGASVPHSQSNILTFSCANEPNVDTLSSSSQPVPYDASVSTPVATFIDSTAPSANSHPIFLSSLAAVSPSGEPTPPSPLTSCGSSTIPISAGMLLSPMAPSGAASLTSSLDSLGKDSALHLDKRPSSLVSASLSTETVTTASVQSPLNLITPFQVSSVNKDSIILPLHSPIHSPSKNASVHTIPNTTSLFILIPNSPVKQNMSKCVKTDEAQEEVANDIVKEGDLRRGNRKRQAEQILQNSSCEGEFDVDFSGDRKRHLTEVGDLPPSQSRRPPPVMESAVYEEKENQESRSSPAKDSCAVLSSVEADSPESAVSCRDVNEEYSSNRTLAKEESTSISNSARLPCTNENISTPTCDYWNTMDTIINSNSGPTKNTNPPQINDLIRNAFIDFKNCLTPNKNGDMPIHVAVQEGNEVAVKRQCVVLAARRASVNIFNREDETPLQLALICGYSSIAVLLLGRGADATVVDKEENSTLHLAVRHADHVALQALLQCGQIKKTTADSYNDEGFTPLHLAAQLNKVKDINLLVKYGCEIDKVDAKSGRTALYLAIERRNYRAQKALVRLGADMKEPTFFGSTPLYAAKSDVFSQLASGQHVADVVESDAVRRPRKRRKLKFQSN